MAERVTALKRPWKPPVKVLRFELAGRYYVVTWTGDEAPSPLDIFDTLVEIIAFTADSPKDAKNRLEIVKKEVEKIIERYKKEIELFYET